MFTPKEIGSAVGISVNVNTSLTGFTPKEITKSMYYTYVLRSKKDNKWYTGFTSDLRKRLKEHNDGKVHSTKNRGPFELIYYEGCINKKDAQVREGYF